MLGAMVEHMYGRNAEAIFFVFGSIAAVLL